jgi:hypothetical protein
MSLAPDSSGVLLALTAVAWIALAISKTVQAQHRGTDDVEPTTVCAIAGPKGPWDHYQTKDLPRGSSASASCAVWTKDSCPGAGPIYPGPAIRWTCVCDTGTWRCDERERTKAACTRQTTLRGPAVRLVAIRENGPPHNFKGG